MSSIITHNFEPLKRGATLESIGFAITINGQAASITSADIDFRLTPGGPSLLRMSSYGTSPKLSLATPGMVRIISHIPALEDGNYIFDVRTVLADGRTKFYIDGSLPIGMAVTHE